MIYSLVCETCVENKFVLWHEVDAKDVWAGN